MKILATRKYSPLFSMFSTIDLIPMRCLRTKLQLARFPHCIGLGLDLGFACVACVKAGLTCEVRSTCACAHP